METPCPESDCIIPYLENGCTSTNGSNFYDPSPLVEVGGCAVTLAVGPEDWVLPPGPTPKGVVESSSLYAKRPCSLDLFLLFGCAPAEESPHQRVSLT